MGEEVLDHSGLDYYEPGQADTANDRSGPKASRKRKAKNT